MDQVPGSQSALDNDLGRKKEEKHEEDCKKQVENFYLVSGFRFIPIFATSYLIGAPVPHGRYAESNEDARPRQTAVIVGPDQMHRVFRQLATLQVRVAQIFRHNRSIRKSLKVLLDELIITANPNKACNGIFQ